MVEITLAALILGPLFLVIGLVFIYGASKRFLLYQKIKNTPTSKTRSVAAGLVELFGKALCQQDMSSPVSKQKCTYWCIKGQYFQSGKNGGWRILFSKSSSNPFYLEDDTGKMVIDPTKAEVQIPVDLESTGYLTEKGFLGMRRTELDPRVLAYLETDPDAKSRFNAYSGNELKLIEYVMAEGDPLFVFGDALSREGRDGSAGEEDLIVKMGNDKVMFISDSNEYKALESIRNSIIVAMFGGLLFSAIGLYAVLSLFGV